MSRVKSTVSEFPVQPKPTRQMEPNPFDPIVATLDGETMGRPQRLEMLGSGQGERLVVRKSKLHKAA